MEVLKERIAHALAAEPYDARATLGQICEIPEFGSEFSMPNSGKHGYPLLEHTFMVCRMFELAFPEWPFEQWLSRTSFRLLLCLHDAGKPGALRMENKGKQHDLTVDMIKRYAYCWPLPETHLHMVLGLLSDDALGLFIRSKIDQEEAATRIRRMYWLSQRPRLDKFFKILTVYYQADSGAYTRYAYTLPDPFIPKPKLEAVFLWRDDGSPIYDPGRKRLLFADPVESRYHRLKLSLTE